MAKYICARGHVFDAGRDSTFAVLRVMDDEGEHDFLYCPRCWGSWAQMSWPLRLVTEDKANG